MFRVFFRIAQIFILGCFSLLSLSVAIDPAASALHQILDGAGAAALALLTIFPTRQGIMAIVAALHGKKGTIAPERPRSRQVPVTTRDGYLLSTAKTHCYISERIGMR
jgi:hypothetical protein